MLLTVDLARLDVRPGHLLLDAGCGEGRHCFGSQNRGAHVVGLDLDLPAMKMPGKVLRKQGREKGQLGAMLQGDAFHLPFADATFDRIICSEVMEHVHDYGSAVRELVRVLRPGGTIGVTIPTAITEWFYLAATRLYFESPGGHIRVFRPRDLALALARAGVRVDGVGFAHALHTPYWLVRAGLGLDDETPGPTRAFRSFLIRAAVSRVWTRVEHALDRVWPKSLVLYGTRKATGRS